ncbi:membrane protein [Angustibacter aerolatus]|uniref:Membrane protein n=1 Tax=Angustibacter aerolatus TaxID=1162965 RepID=A0ABQ6JFW8_9ACTN|nr:membrane protein [Angustibacter aerolatus]
MPASTPARRTARSTVVRALLVAFVVLVFLACGLTTLVAISTETGLTGLVAGFVLALVPVSVVVPALLWLDRFEAEPTSLVLFAFAWGAVVATAIALVLNTYSLVLLRDSGGDVQASSVLVAPFVEEACKGAAVVLVVLWRRRDFDGVVDGIVYAGLAGIGFAFTENVLYLGRALAESGTQGLAVTFVLRAVLGPFAHPLFTMATGVGIGLAVRSRHRVTRVVAPVVGYLVAVTLHGLWNLSAVAGLRGFLSLYVLVQVPIFLAAVSFALWARRREVRLVADHLGVYAASGWFVPAEVEMLGSTAGRRQARSWARRTGGPVAARAMRGFQDVSTDLAFHRDRLVRGTVQDEGRAVEREPAAPGGRAPVRFRRALRPLAARGGRQEPRRAKSLAHTQLVRYLPHEPLRR